MSSILTCGTIFIGLYASERRIMRHTALQRKANGMGIGHIYFIQATTTGYIKIGWTKNIAQRFRYLKGHSGDHLDLRIHVSGPIEQSKALEKMLHKYYRQFRLYGEWFAPNPDLLDKIEKLRAGLGAERLAQYDIDKVSAMNPAWN